MKNIKSKKENNINEEQELEVKKIRSILDVLKNNCTWIIGVLTFLGLIMKGMLEFAEYITSEIYFSYYGLNHGLYNYSNKGGIYDLIISIIFALAFISVLACCEQLKEQIKNKNILSRKNFKNIKLIIVSNIYIVLTSSEKKNMIEIPILVIALIIFEMLISGKFFNEFKNMDKTQIDRDQLRKNFVDYIKLIPYILVFLIFMNTVAIYLNLQYQKEYNIINNNKVTIYTTNDYYLTLDCDINGDEIVIYRGRQEKIDNNNIKTQKIKFNKVKVQQ